MSIKNRFVMFGRINAVGFLGVIERSEITEGRDKVTVTKGTPVRTAAELASTLEDIVNNNTLYPVSIVRDTLGAEIEAGIDGLVSNADTLGSTISLKVGLGKSATVPGATVLVFSYRYGNSRQKVEMVVEGEPVVVPPITEPDPDPVPDPTP